MQRSNIELFYPSGFQGGAIHGAFLVDSFYYFKNSPNGMARPYMQELLDWLYKETGAVFMAACCGGAAVESYCDGAAVGKLLLVSCCGGAAVGELP